MPISSGGEYCSKCKRGNPIAFHVEPEEAWKVVVLNRWRNLCPSCFDQLAEQTGVSYRFVDLEGQSWTVLRRVADPRDADVSRAGQARRAPG
jgi:hypothetical protein